MEEYYFYDINFINLWTLRELSIFFLIFLIFKITFFGVHLRAHTCYTIHWFSASPCGSEGLNSSCHACWKCLNLLILCASRNNGNIKKYLWPNKMQQSTHYFQPTGLSWTSSWKDSNNVSLTTYKVACNFPMPRLRKQQPFHAIGDLCTVTT